jgi:hypothetical protein
MTTPKVNWSESDQFYWVKNADGEVLTFDSVLDAKDAARQIEIDIAVKAEVNAITTWLRKHGMRQVSTFVEEGRYK